MPLAIDYRPKTIEEVIGNDSIKDSLRSVFSREKDFPHAFLFHGSSGTGKTTFARIIGSLLGCNGQDFMEYNTAEARGIDTVREIDQNCRYAPLDGKFKIYLLDEVHRGTLDFQSSLLKLLEDAPSHVIFILCTTEPEKVLRTIRTRCMMFQTKGLLMHQMTDLLKSVLKSEGLEGYPNSIIEEIVKCSEGCPRQALVLLDSVIDILDEEKALEAVTSFKTQEASVIDICRLLIANEKGKWKKMKELIKVIDEEPESIRYAILGYFTKVLLDGANDKVATIMEIFFENWMYSKKAGMTWALYQACKFN
jgi:DNA polymerase-3 subunit gamma/tau